MEKARGTVTILDAEATTFSRIWCGYEVYTSLTLGAGISAKKQYSYDIYTWCDNLRVAVGLMDGLAGTDDDSAVWRQEKFPIRLAFEALQVRIETAKASDEKDRVHILNAIAGRALNSKPPLEWHPQYFRVNRLLRGRFAAGVWPTVLEGGDAEHLHKFSEAIRTSGAASLRLDAREFSRNLVPEFDSFISALPPKGNRNLRQLHLCLACNSIGDVECGKLARAVAGFGQLRVLELELYESDIGPEGARALAAAIAQLRQLGELQLHLSNNAIDIEGASALVEAAAGLPTLCMLALYFDDNPLGEEAEAVFEEAKGRMLERGVDVDIVLYMTVAHTLRMRIPASWPSLRQ